MRLPLLSGKRGDEPAKLSRDSVRIRSRKASGCRLLAGCPHFRVATPACTSSALEDIRISEHDIIALG